MLGVVINLSGKSSISINLFLGFLLVVDLKVRNPKIKAKREVKKVKLKVDGVTRTIQANLTANGVTGGGSSKNSQSPDDSRPRQKQNLQGISDDSLSPLDKRSGLQGIPWKDFSRVRFSLGKEDQLTGKSTGKNSFGKKGDHSGAVLKEPDAFSRAVKLAGGWPGEHINWNEILTQTLEMAEECVNTNYYDVKRMAEALVPLLQLSDSPRIVNVTSLLGTLKVIENLLFPR
ncbi:hypothetical protein Pint_00380 [Pistacia integerrima]|uniref:Uncharacterized protein n=1 Tax=Pistacia integerrima TaxID=434235 RepID=A0ACC0ZM36_9ROSI|nr:hypothetical protein Pint_00380 [Pistacia integerrima]